MPQSKEVDFARRVMHEGLKLRDQINQAIVVERHQLGCQLVQATSVLQDTIIKCFQETPAIATRQQLIPIAHLMPSFVQPSLPE